MKKSILVSLLSGAVILLGSVTAMAASLTYTTTGSTSLLPIPANISLSIPQWDPNNYPSYYELESVDVQWTGSQTGTIFATNLALSRRTITAILGADIDLRGPDGLDLLAAPKLTVSRSLGALSAYTWTNQTSFEIITESLTDPAALAYYIGNGNVGLNALITNNSSYSPSNTLVTFIPHSASGELSVTYEYSTVPEPSTILLVGAGLGGLALLRRRK